jgi:hypothetical protein
MHTTSDMTKERESLKPERALDVVLWAMMDL